MPAPTHIHTYMPTLGNPVTAFCAQRTYIQISWQSYQGAFPDSQMRLRSLLWATTAPVLPCVPALVILVVTLDWHICHGHQAVNSSGAGLVYLILGPQ